MDQNIKATPNATASATPAKKLDPKYEAWKTERAAAKKRLEAFVKANAEQLGPLVKDIQFFIGGGQRKSSGTIRSVNTDLRDAFLAKKSLSEMDIFKMFKIGRPEMTGKIRILVLCPNPADRVWVAFDEAKEVYNVMGTGANPPAGWDGYVPSAKIANL